MEENNVNEALELMRAEYEGIIRELKLSFGVETGLLKAGARNVKAAAALLDFEALALDEKGGVTGLAEQIARLKGDKESAFLFEKEEPIKGLIPCESTDVPDTGEMSYSRFCEIYSMN